MDGKGPNAQRKALRRYSRARSFVDRAPPRCVVIAAAEERRSLGETSLPGKPGNVPFPEVLREFRELSCAYRYEFRRFRARLDVLGRFESRRPLLARSLVHSIRC